MDNAWGPIGMFSAGQPGNKEQRLNVHGIFRYLYVLAAIVGPDGHFTHGQCERTVSPCMLVLFNPVVQEMQPLAPNVPSPLFFFVLRRMFFRGTDGIHRVHRRRNDNSNVKCRTATGDVRPSSWSFLHWFQLPPSTSGDVRGDRARAWKGSFDVRRAIPPPRARARVSTRMRTSFSLVFQGTCLSQSIAIHPRSASSASFRHVLRHASTTASCSPPRRTASRTSAANCAAHPCVADSSTYVWHASCSSTSLVAARRNVAIAAKLATTKRIAIVDVRRTWDRFVPSRVSFSKGVRSPFEPGPCRIKRSLSNGMDVGTTRLQLHGEEGTWWWMWHSCGASHGDACAATQLHPKRCSGGW